MALISLTNSQHARVNTGTLQHIRVIVATRNILVIEHYSLFIKLGFMERDIKICGV